MSRAIPLSTIVGKFLINQAIVFGVITIAAVYSIYHAHAANLKYAESISGSHLDKIIVLEGEIVPGDAMRLLDALLYEDHIFSDRFIDTIYLRSNGGNIDEAIRIGQIVRRLRLATSVAVFGTSKVPTSIVFVADKNSSICASACFLIYAAGIDRFGNYLALHRPYVSKADASKLNDAEYEVYEKAAIAKVRAYLDYMEVDKFWVDKMLSTNSQNEYIVPWDLADNKNYHLMGTVPSIEEVLLSKCDEFNTECNKTALDEIRKAAFDREVDAILTTKCNKLTHKETKTLNSPKQSVDQLEFNKAQEKSSNYLRCVGDVWDQIWGDTHIEPADHPDPASLNVRQDAEDQKLAAALQSAAQGDVKAQITLGNLYSERGDHIKAILWFFKAVEHSNADAEVDLGLELETVDRASDAIYWYKKAAQQGSQLAEFVLGTKYMSGEGVSQDYMQAYMWFVLSGSKGATNLLADITPHMTPAQIAEAQQLARDWRPSK